MNAQQRVQRQLEEVLKAPGNDKCADCKANSPRWASINLGIFLCVTCASAHRKMGTHTSRVKSVTLDEWTRDQVNTMKQIGNTRSNEIYNPSDRHPAPTATGGDERDSEISKYIRRKYELGAFKAGAAKSLSTTAVNSRVQAQQYRGRDLGVHRDLPALPTSPPKPPVRSSSRQRSPGVTADPWASVSVNTSAPTLAPPARGGTSPRPPSDLPPRSASSLSPKKNTLIDIEGSTSSTRPLQLSTGDFPTISVPPRPGFAPAASPGPMLSPLALGQQAFFTPSPWQQQQMQMQMQMQPNMTGMGMNMGMISPSPAMNSGSMNGGYFQMGQGMGGMAMSPNGGGNGMGMAYGMPMQQPVQPVQQQYGQYQWM